MKDNSSVQNEPARSTEKDKKVVELTPDMEITPEKGGNIYDLTKAVDGTVYTAPAAKQPSEPAFEGTQQADLEQTEATPKSPADIEKQVDEAFEAIQPYSPIDLSEDSDEEPSEEDTADDFQLVDEDISGDTSAELDLELEPAEPDFEEGATLLDIEPTGQDESQHSPGSDDTQDEFLELADLAATDEMEELTPDLADEDFLLAEDEHEKFDDAEPQTPNEIDDARDETLELSDLVSPDEAEGMTPEVADDEIPMAEDERDKTDDDEIIDLVDIIASEKVGEPSAQSTEDSPPRDRENEDIIDLVDIVSSPARPVEEVTVNQPDDDEEDTIELTDMVKLSESIANLRKENGRLSPDADESLEEDLASEDQVIKLSDVLNNARKRNRIQAQSNLDGPGKETQTGQELPSGMGTALEDQFPGVSEKAIEAAVERYIQTKYDGDIERMVAAVIEKTVAREIEALKQRFLNENEEPE